MGARGSKPKEKAICACGKTCKWGTTCSTCYQREYKKTHPEYAAKQKEATKLWQKVNREKHKECRRATHGRTSKFTRHGVTREWYLEQRELQDQLCPICLTEPKKWFVIDHDHKTGKARGVICSHCNSGLGMFRDDMDSMKRAIKYLERASSAQ